ncbi:MAG: cytochrome-c oxidase, cbb3-type subunit III [Variovorax sp.]
MANKNASGNNAPGNEHDPVTGRSTTGRSTTGPSTTGPSTTGHEWDGLKELNTPLPKWWFWTFVATVVWGIGYAVAYPSVPWLNGYFPGVLGYSQRAVVTADVRALTAQRAGIMEKLKSVPLADVKKDEALYAVALTAGRLVFAENCKACHGAGGEGRTGYPALAGDAWIWGGSLDAIQQTVTYGIRSGHADARISLMPRFGVDGMLKDDEIDRVTDHVMTLYAPAAPATALPANAAKGQALFAENCAACHGDKGEGRRDVGAPALRSGAHLYGDTRGAVRAQIANPKQGVMPNWNVRLDEATIRAVTLYVHALGGGE